MNVFLMAFYLLMIILFCRAQFYNGDKEMPQTGGKLLQGAKAILGNPLSDIEKQLQRQALQKIVDEVNSQARGWEVSVICDENFNAWNFI